MNTTRQILIQPATSTPMSLHTDEKIANGFADVYHHQCQDGHCQYINSSPHGQCHRSRAGRLLWISILSILSVLTLVALFCAWHMELGGSARSWLVEWGLLAPADLAKRATGSNGNSPFVNKKLYLIVILVGLVVVVILGIMLTACCCRSAFKNPLCCPCYLCACCGGLACLECIACGLCAEGIENV